MTLGPDSTEVRILVADDHTLLREALCDLLRLEPGFRVVAQTGDGASAVDLARSTLPDVALLDLGMPGNRPLETVRRLLQVSARTRIIILTMYADTELVQELLALGIRGYLHKSVSRSELASTIRIVCATERRMVSVSWKVREASKPATPPLSTRELEVLVLVAEAMSNRQIAARLDITEGTVKRHLRNVFGKLGAVSRLDAVNKAIQASSIPPASRLSPGSEARRRNAPSS